MDFTWTEEQLKYKQTVIEFSQKEHQLEEAIRSLPIALRTRRSG